MAGVGIGSRKTKSQSGKTSNTALNIAPFGRWTLRDKAAQRRLALLDVMRPKIILRKN
jgi:hypothetical protein